MNTTPYAIRKASLRGLRSLNANVHLHHARLGLAEPAKAAKKAKRPAWPGDVITQIGAIKQLLAENPQSPDEITARFRGAKAEIVGRHLEILHVMGEAQLNPDGRYEAVFAGSVP